MKAIMLFTIGLLCLMLATANILIWIIISTQQDINFDGAVSKYVNLFPELIAKPIILTFLNILLLSIAIICFVYFKMKSNNAFFKKVCITLIILSGILAFWNLFSLM